MSRSPRGYDSDARPEHNLYISNLSYSTQDRDLEQRFSKFGPVKHCKIIRDHETGRSRGYGFVAFERAEDAERAKDSLDDTEIDARKIRIEKARKSDDRRSNYRRREESPRRERRSPRRERRSPRRSYRSDRSRRSPESPRDRSPRRRSPRRYRRSSS